MRMEEEECNYQLISLEHCVVSQVTVNQGDLICTFEKDGMIYIDERLDRFRLSNSKICFYNCNPKSIIEIYPNNFRN